jgi:hypothetical protein
MKFTSHGRQYEIDPFGVIVQTDHRPFVYDPKYSAIYDKAQYRRGSDILQAMRLGFVQGCHGKEVKSLMDVGYGNGAFINFAKQHIPYVYGHDVTGVPLNGAYVMPELVKASVYCFWDVLEHFPDLSFVRDLPCETICLSLPYCHFVTEGKTWFDEKYPHRKPDEHIRHFTQFSLGSLMDSFGWKTIAVSGHEDVIRKSVHGLQNILSMAFKRK